MKLQIIKHNSILFKDVLRAIAVKSAAWPYPLESQVKWIIDNMTSEDMHVFLTDEGKDIAYMTLSPVKGVLNGKETSFNGIGCVCAVVKGMGYGKRLMQEVNSYLENNNFKGLLFCKEGVVEFYQKNRWQLIPRNCIHSENLHEGVLTMVYNCEEVKSLEYADREF